MGPGTTFEGTREFLLEDRQGFFVSCWYTFDHETATMWEKYGRGPEGIAVRTRYGVLEQQFSASPDKMFFGQVRYGLFPHRFNLLHFITTKRVDYSAEREVRGVIWRGDLSPRNPYPHDSPVGLKHTVDFKALAEEIIVAPTAPSGRLEEVKALIGRLGYATPVRESGLTPYATLMPSVADIKKYCE
jgi:hypothetical protein